MPKRLDRPSDEYWEKQGAINYKEIVRRTRRDSHNEKSEHGSISPENLMYGLLALEKEGLIKLAVNENGMATELPS